MIITLQEDRVLYIYDSAETAALDIEALDADETFLSVFDEHAQPYEIEWIRPNEEWGQFGASRLNGEYRLVAAGDPDEPGLLEAIRRADRIDPPSKEEAIRKIEKRLDNRFIS
jgi:hypothetical protein